MNKSDSATTQGVSIRASSGGAEGAPVLGGHSTPSPHSAKSLLGVREVPLLPSALAPL